MANEFIARKGLIALQDSQITGSLGVTGNITVTGTVDGVDVATLKSDFDTLEGKTLVSGSSQITIGSTTGTITSAKISDVDAFSQSGTYASLRAQGTTKGDVGLGNVENTALSTYTGNGGALDNQYITNGAGYTTNTGTVTSVGGTGTVDGLTLSGTVTSTGNLTLGGAISITTSSITNFPTEVSRSAAAAGFGSGGGGGSDFPYTGSAIISGSLEIIGKITGSVLIEGSGSTLFEIVGSEGQLFSVTDNLSGSLFAVSDVSGLPILEVFSDDTVKIGTFNNEAIIVNGSTAIVSGSFSGSFEGDGSGLTGVGSVDTTGTPANDQIAIFTDSNTIEGD